MTRYFLRSTIEVAACRVIPIERVDIQAGGAAGARWLFAQRTLHAFVISDENGVRGLGPGGEVLSLGDVVRHLPEPAALAQILRQGRAEAQVWRAPHAGAPNTAGNSEGTTVAPQALRRR